MKSVPTDPSRGNIKKKTSKPYRFKHQNTGAVAWCAGRTRLPIAVVDAALVALTRFDGRWSVDDRELVAHLVEHIALDQFSAHRLVRALRFWYDIELAVYVEMHGDQPDGAS